jgi:hypothetical protein
MNIPKKTCHQAQLIVMLFLVGVMAGQTEVVLLEGEIDVGVEAWSHTNRVTMYYWATRDHFYQHIAASVWRH